MDPANAQNVYGMDIDRHEEFGDSRDGNKATYPFEIDSVHHSAVGGELRSLRPGGKASDMRETSDRSIHLPARMMEDRNFQRFGNSLQIAKRPDTIVLRSVTQYRQEISVSDKPLDSVEKPAEFAEPDSVQLRQVSGGSAISGGSDFVRSRAPSPYPDDEIEIEPQDTELPIASEETASQPNLENKYCLTPRETILSPPVQLKDTSGQPYFAPNFLETLFDSPPESRISSGSFELLQSDDDTNRLHSYYASTGGASASQSKDKDVLSKLFEKYRGTWENPSG